MHDMVIRGGLLVDGTGAPPREADIAIDGEMITAVGVSLPPGKREVNAVGKLVTPGWVDIHTHYDGQAMWDPLLLTSSLHGVTTVVFGNCGVGFAPVHASDRANLISLMEGVEEIPEVVLDAGLKWDWETFPQYLDALDAVPRAIDIGAQVAHHPLRMYVMGERAMRRERATDEDIATMRKLTAEAMAAGALGFTTSRTQVHKNSCGDLAPAFDASIEELFGIAEALTLSKRGAFGINSDFDDEEAEVDWMAELSRKTGRPVWFLMTEHPSDPARWRRLINLVDRANQSGAMIFAQVAGRPVGLIMGVGTNVNPFTIRPSFASLAALSAEDCLAAMRRPEVRAQLIADKPSAEMLAKLSPFRQAIATSWDRIFLMGDSPDYEPPPEASVMAAAQREGRTPDEVAYDYITKTGTSRFLFFPLANYAEGNLDVVLSMLKREGTILGLGDGGAHCSSIMDAGIASYMLTHWTRDRHRGERLPLEFVVKLLTSETAAFMGLHDRGRLAAGLRADINIIDYTNLQLHVPEVWSDMPANGRRLIQRVDGYEMTIVAGTPVFERGEHTGALPGRLIRGHS